MKRVRVFVKGKVQGVFFRAYTQRAAREFQVKGWVRNLPDGRVEALFEGNKTQVDAMIAWCGRGPSRAIVENLDAAEEPYLGEFKDFLIRYE